MGNDARTVHLGLTWSSCCFFSTMMKSKYLLTDDVHKMTVYHMKAAIILGDLGFESDILQDHSSVLATNLNKSRSLIYPSQSKATKLSAMLPSVADMVDKKHKKLHEHRSIIENRKEEQEHLLEMGNIHGHLIVRL